jgi:hypothetical protein
MFTIAGISFYVFRNITTTFITANAGLLDVVTIFTVDFMLLSLSDEAWPY